MKLSFVIPAWNEEKYIGKTIDSVIREVEKSQRDVEIIVVNNASTDRTREIAQEFPGVRVVDEPRKGLPMARQAGFLASSGHLIANVDADSILPSGWIEKVYREFSRNDNLVALSGPYIYYDLSRAIKFSGFIYYFFGYLIHLVNHHILKSGAMLQGGNFILRRDALEKIGGFDVKIKFYGEDTDIARRIQKTGRVKFKFSLPMYTSGRRLKKEGLIRTTSRYTINYFWVLLFKKPFTADYSYAGDKMDGEKIYDQKNN
jgi:glycosyltransferase involved in cell wall biosynthesis